MFKGFIFKIKNTVLFDYYTVYLPEVGNIRNLGVTFKLNLFFPVVLNRSV